MKRVIITVTGDERPGADMTAYADSSTLSWKGNGSTRRAVALTLAQAIFQTSQFDLSAISASVKASRFVAVCNGQAK